MLGDVRRSRDGPRLQGCGGHGPGDEALSMGFIGERGRGVAEAQGVIDDVDFIIGTFSKSVGSVGSFCVSNHPKFEFAPRLPSLRFHGLASPPPSLPRPRRRSAS